MTMTEDDTTSERMLPFDEYAEMCALGGMMISRAAIRQVSEIVRPGDFYRPAHQLIYDAAMALDSRGEPVDAISVNAELERRGEAGRYGGAPYLHTLTDKIPTASNAGYYAKIVSDKAVLRRLVEVGTRTAQIGYAGDGELAELVAHCQQMVVDIESLDTADGVDLVHASEVYRQVVDDQEAVDDGGVVTPPYADLREVLPSVKPGQVVIVGARPAVGKALALDTPIPTPAGWTTMKDIAVGDYVMGMDGKPAKVTVATEVMHDRTCYEVEFSDGSVIVADAEHLWFTETRSSRRSATPPGGYEFKRNSPLSRDQRWKAEQPGIKTTEEIRSTLRVGSDQRVNHSVPLAAPFELPNADLPIDPYILGYWLGDGSSYHPHFSVSGEDLPNFISQVKAAGYHHSEPKPYPSGVCFGLRVSTQPVTRGGIQVGRDSLAGRLRGLDLIKNKHIPDSYLRASENQRRALLAGLLDSDGTINTVGRVSFEVTSRRLAEQFFELAASLGYKPEVNTKRVKGRSEKSSTCYRVGFVSTDKVFRLERKNARVPERCQPRNRRRYVVAVRPVDSVPVRCITVDNDDHMYLAGRECIPTHNSVVATDWARHNAMHNQVGTVLFSLEMTNLELGQRIMAAEAGVLLKPIRDRELAEDDWERVVKVKKTWDLAPFWMSDDFNISLPHMRSRLRKHTRSHKVDLVIVDYLQLFDGPQSESRQQEVSKISRGLKKLAKEFGIVVIVLSQLNRESTKRSDKKPQLSDLRESGSIEQDADIVLLLDREDTRDKESPRAGEVDIDVAKNRNGPGSREVVCAFQGHYSRIVDMAGAAGWGGPR